MAKGNRQAAAEAAVGNAYAPDPLAVRHWEATCTLPGGEILMPRMVFEAVTAEVAEEKYRVKYGIRRDDAVIVCKPVG